MKLFIYLSFGTQLIFPTNEIDGNKLNIYFVINVFRQKWSLKAMTRLFMFLIICLFKSYTVYILLSS